ncbi:mitochondrial enolase superfamily member 1 [Grus japonensis]|uniref:Mitochondrial enolase superfamily member 1 n=1 Tax=Grus japonensis TaxID=30415 RepID=A0ABC9W2H6_GRUJA
MPAGSKMDLLLAKAEPISNGVTGNFTLLLQVLKYDGQQLSNFIRHFHQDLRMYLIGFHGLARLQVPHMVSHLIFYICLIKFV